MGFKVNEHNFLFILLLLMTKRCLQPLYLVQYRMHTIFEEKSAAKLKLHLLVILGLQWLREYVLL